MPTPTVPAATDSPWFWACSFCTGALIALYLLEPKYGPRQAQIEKQYQGREFAARAPAGTESVDEFSSSRNTLITLRPLYLVLSVLVAISWVVFWWKRRIVISRGLS